MKKKVGKKSLKIIAATSMAIFSLMTTFTAAFAWFVSERHAEDSTDAFNVKPISSFFNKMTFHDIVHTSNTTYQFDQEPCGTISVVDYETKTTEAHFDDGAVYNMGKYDYLEKSHPVLLLIELGETDGLGVTATAQRPVKVKATTETNYFIGDGNSHLYSQEEIEDEEGINPLSSIVSYYSYSFESATSLSNIEGSYGDGAYDTYDFTVSALTDCGSFVEFEDQDYTEFNNEVDLFNATSGTVKYVAVIFDYYELAIETIYNQYIGNPVLEEELLFTCDWTLVV